jgi:outer membrane protein assembly factor BamB
VEGILVVASSEGKVYGVDVKTGEPKWAQPVKVGESVMSAPQVWSSTVYVSAQDGTLYALKARSGTTLWHIPTRQ